MHTNNHSPDRPNELTHVLQEMGQSLHRLVELGESVLGVLTAHGAAVDKAAPPATASGSVGCSARSEKGTDEGVFDLSEEDVVSFAEASQMIPTHPSVSTISRWCTLACRGVQLESTYYGGRRKTTRQAVERFLLACREQGWAGMHQNSAFYLERAIVKKERLHDQKTSGQPSPNDRVPITTQRADTTRTRRPKFQHKIPPRSKPTSRHTKRRKRGS